MNRPSGEPKKSAEQKSGGLLGKIRRLGDQATEALDQASGGRLRSGVDATKEKVADAGSTVTGKKIQQQLEDFTEVVSTAVIGVHRDQRNLRDEQTHLRVQQTGFKLDLSQIRGEQSAVIEAIAQAQQDQAMLQETVASIQLEQGEVKETLGRVQTKQTEGNATLAEVKRKQDALTESLEQMKESMRRMKQPSRYPGGCSGIGDGYELQASKSN